MDDFDIESYLEGGVDQLINNDDRKVKGKKDLNYERCIKCHFKLLFINFVLLIDIWITQNHLVREAEAVVHRERIAGKGTLPEYVTTNTLAIRLAIEVKETKTTGILDAGFLSSVLQNIIHGTVEKS